MKHVVITGGSRGIGFGLVNEFIKNGCSVTFCARSDRTLNEALDKLSESWNSKMFKGIVCDVTRMDELATLSDFATKIFGQVDIWINNAGVSNEEVPFHNLSPDQFLSVIETNLKGVMLGTHAALNIMKSSESGFIYNMGGLGSDGRMIKGLAPYGTTKRAVEYFTMALAKEIKGDPVKIGLLLPGMVITDMILDPVRQDPLGSKRFIRILNILAEEVDPVAEFLVNRILENNNNGARISFMSAGKMMRKFVSAPFVRRDIVAKYL